MPLQPIAKLISCVLILILCYLFALPQGTGLASDSDRWSLNNALELPDWFSIAGEYRARYETLNSQFRANSTGSDQILSLRTLVQAELRFNKNFKIKAELQDSRAELADEGSRMNNTIVNAAELLEANFAWSMDDLFAIGSTSKLRGGRLTMDIGKRRLVARNRFRNTIQAFTGIDWEWKANDGNQTRMFLTLPVTRLPFDRASLLNNEVEFDKETTDQVFWGIFYGNSHLPWGTRGELYLFGLHEEDAPDFLTRNRQLYTPGFRFYRPAKKSGFDFEWESVIQFGTSRATPLPSDTRDLDHLAHFHHVEAGFTFQSTWLPRLLIEYDYSSGDNDPDDGTHERFDSLFGPGVLDFGPTSIYTAFTRVNVNSPGVRLQVRPGKNLFADLSYRAFWLASVTDLWAGALLRDSSGKSGNFLGHQLFLRIKWGVFPNLKLEGGVTYRIDGEFPKTATNSPREGNTVYSYIATTFSF